MIDVIVTTNPFEQDEYVLHETDNLIAFIRDQFPVWPENARIYNGNVAESCDVTPRDEQSIYALNKLEGPVFIIVYPGDPVTAIIVSVVAIAALAAVAFLLIKVPSPDMGSAPSSNNSLSDRSNKARPNSRIPDIFGKVRSIPDLIALPYRIFENHQEIEISYMCIGRGQYDIEDVRDGDTLLGSISGAGATFYGPNTSPNLGTPQLTIGTTITQDLYSVVKLNEVNGQTLIPTNTNSVRGASNIRFVPPNVIETNSGSIDFSAKFDAGQTLSVSNATYGGASFYTSMNEDARFYADKTVEFDTFDPSTIFSVGDVVTISGAVFTEVETIDLSGTYTINTVTSTTIELD